MPNYSLELELFSLLNASTSNFEIWADGALLSSHTIISAGTTVTNPTISYAGALPASLEFRFNDSASGSVDQIEVRSVKINDRYVNIGNYLSSNILNDGGSSTVNIASSDYIFDSSADPAGSEFTVGVTQTFTAGNDFYRGYSETTAEVFDMLGGRDYAYLGSGNDKVSGGAGNDVLRGGAGNDLLFGDSNNDRIYGGTGDDTLYGGTGNDRIHGNAGDDKIHGGAGDDRLNGHADNDVITGGAGDDKLTGGNGNDSLFGDADDDKLTGGSGNDTLDGGDGNDLLYGGSGVDQMDGGDGTDTLVGDAGDDVMNGGDGDDVLYGRADNDILNGGAGNDKIYGGDGNDTIDGGANADTIYGDATGSNLLVNGGFEDTSNGVGSGVTPPNWIKTGSGGGVYSFPAGRGSEGSYAYPIGGWGAAVGGDISQIVTTQIGETYTLTFDAGVNLGTSGTLSVQVLNGAVPILTDSIIDTSASSGLHSYGYSFTATSTATTIFFELTASTGDVDFDLDNVAVYTTDVGVDTISGGAGDDIIYGEAGDDILSGGDDDDTLYGGAGLDILTGEAGDDVIEGGAGDDFIDGGDGADILAGGDGDDIVHGGGLTDSEISTILDANPSVVYNADTNSFYQYVNASLFWTAADAAAQAMTLSGVSGHLANVTSQGERDYIWNTVLNSGAGTTTRIFIGGREVSGEGDWRFTAGAEAGIQFSDAAGTALNGMYTNFAPGQPNNYGGNNQEFLSIQNTGAGWDDMDNSIGSFGYVVEWNAGSISDDSAVDTLDGAAGDDFLYGYGGADILSGGDDDDVLLGGSGNDTLNGGDGDDTLVGGVGDDTLVGGTQTRVVITAANLASYDVGSPFGNSDYGAAPTIDLDDNVGVELASNHWKEYLGDFVVTANTILEFDFKSDAEPEIALIGFETDNDFSFAVTNIFQIFGLQHTQIQAFNDYDTYTLGDWVHYEIDVGTYFTGTFDRMVFINDDDNGFPGSPAGQNGNIFFKNVVVHEGGSLNDGLIGGDGADELYGDGGLDTFLFEDTNDVDVIHYFNTQDGDILDISNILTNFTGASDIDDYVNFTNSGDHVIMSVDVNGTTGGASFVNIAEIQGQNDFDEVALYGSSNIIV